MQILDVQRSYSSVENTSKPTKLVQQREEEEIDKIIFFFLYQNYIVCFQHISQIHLENIWFWFFFLNIKFSMTDWLQKPRLLREISKEERENKIGASPKKQILLEKKFRSHLTLFRQLTDEEILEKVEAAKEFNKEELDFESVWNTFHHISSLSRWRAE